MSTNEITDLLARYDAWWKNREELSAMEESEDGPASSSQWESSDDHGNELGGEAIELLRKPLKIWTLSVYGPEQPLTTTVHKTEEECWESLRESHDPEGLADDEPPVAIVDFLQYGGQNLHIEIDVHEVALG